MPGQLQSITIKGLHGKPGNVFKAQIRDNTLIIVGENGSGKTTFLRILFHFLSGRWLALAKFRFESVTAKIDAQEFVLVRSELTKGIEKLDRRILPHFPVAVRKRILDLYQLGRVDALQFEMKKWGVSPRYAEEWLMTQPDLFEAVESGGHSKVTERAPKLRELLGAQILYLPTFRRIERELSSIFEGADIDELRKRQAPLASRESDAFCVELVEFGMKDVQAAIDDVRASIKEFARENLNNLTVKYLGDIVNEDYKNVGPREIAEASDEIIRATLDRIDDSILTYLHKDHLFQAINRARSAGHPTTHDQIIYHYFLKLRSFQEALQEKEKPITAFCSLCSEYIRDKKFNYDRSTFQFSIAARDLDEKIELSDLSSGEKQIVSLFSHLYLSSSSRRFVIIDEPELSLSVPWQRRFLVDIRRGSFCAGLIAATHSPFIYENELRPYAHSLAEFSGY